MKYRFLNEQRDEFTTNLMCRVLRVVRAGFYQWLHEPVSERGKEDERLLDFFRSSYVASHGVYDVRCVFGDLRETAHRVERLMRMHKIKTVRG